jgi:threonine synthase
MPEHMQSTLDTWHFRCLACEFVGQADQAVWKCLECGSELVIERTAEQSRTSRSAGHGLWRFAGLLPVEAPSRGTFLGEGDTPLVPIDIDGMTIHLKLDSQLPTGSFKDRGAAVLAQYLTNIGVNRIIVDSSGNAASSMSAFAAATSLGCTVYVPADASPGKLAQARAYGATVVPVEGSREDVADAAQSAAVSDDSASYASHNWHPVFVEGVSTWAVEIHEQLSNVSPDVVFIPTGGGSSLVGAWRGFKSIGKLVPRLIACQPSACDPVVRAWNQNGEVSRVEPRATIAEGTKIALPSRPRQIMLALEESNGGAISVDEELLKDTLRLLWSRGFYVEPTGALGVAAFRKAHAAGQFRGSETVVAHITGHGLKSTSSVEDLLLERS